LAEGREMIPAPEGALRSIRIRVDHSDDSVNSNRAQGALRARLPAAMLAPVTAGVIREIVRCVGRLGVKLLAARVNSQAVQVAMAVSLGAVMATVSNAAAATSALVDFVLVPRADPVLGGLQEIGIRVKIKAADRVSVALTNLVENAGHTAGVDLIREGMIAAIARVRMNFVPEYFLLRQSLA